MTARAHPAFTHVGSRAVSSLKVEVQRYRHLKTGAEHIHLHSDNAENVFLVALRTVPRDSTGVAHILEHTALCGSEKYPVRDPFFMMIRRSLNTFMNAFTSSDWTAYPFASQNRKDFNNLLDVYLDAVFFSRLLYQQASSDLLLTYFHGNDYVRFLHFEIILLGMITWNHELMQFLQLYQQFLVRIFLA